MHDLAKEEHPVGFHEARGIIYTKQKNKALCINEGRLEFKERDTFSEAGSRLYQLSDRAAYRGTQQHVPCRHLVSAHCVYKPDAHTCYILLGWGRS